MAIDTGGRVVARDSSQPNQVVGKRKVLFDPSSTYTQSGLFTVADKTSVLLTGYNIPEGAEISIQGVSSGSRAIAQGTGCGGACGVAGSSTPDIIFRSTMKLGGNEWKLTSDTDRILIPLPGEYMLVLNDESYLGDLQVELETIPGRQQLPDGYMAGIIA